MNERINFVTHNDKDILYCDFSTLMTKNFIELLDECYDFIKTKIDLLILFDVTDASVFGEAFEHAKDFAKKIQPYRPECPGYPQAFFSGSSKKVQAFSTKEDALDWLAK